MQDPQARDAPGVAEESGEKKEAVLPEGAGGDAPGTTQRDEEA